MYKSEITFASKELTKREKVMLSDVSSATKFDDVIKGVDETFDIEPVAYAVVSIENDKAKGEKQYEVIVILDAAGNKFVTGSRSFREAFIAIWEQMTDNGVIAEGEEFSIRVYKRPSKNYSGKAFISCALI
mgnify:CR=1 FL=1